MRERRTSEDKNKIVNAIELDRKNGLSMKEACKKNGVLDSTYYHWRKLSSSKPGRKPYTRKSTELITMTIPQNESRLVILIGKSSDVKSALDNLASMAGA